MQLIRRSANPFSRAAIQPVCIDPPRGFASKACACPKSRGSAPKGILHDGCGQSAPDQREKNPAASVVTTGDRAR